MSLNFNTMERFLCEEKLGFLSNSSFTVEFVCPFNKGVEYPGSNTVASRLVGFLLGVWETV